MAIPLSTKLSALDYGTYTPILILTANIASANVATPWQYLRVGNIATVSGILTASVTAASTVSQLGISFPIVSVITAQGQCAGTGVPLGIQAMAGGVRGDTTNNGAELHWVNGANTTVRFWCIQFTYLVA